MRQLADGVRRHPLPWFFAVAYGVNAIACAIAVWLAGVRPDAPTWPLWAVGIFSPTIAALVVGWAVGGAAELRRLATRLTRWRIGPSWFLAGAVFALGPLALAGASALLGNAVPGPEAGFTLVAAVPALAYTLVAGPLSEEPGWRGFALPRLEQRFDALTASLLLGTLWAFWHVPFYFLPNQVMIPFPIFIPQCIALSILFTAIFNNTRGSALATVNAHFWFNFSGAWLAGHLGILPPMLLYAGGSVMAVILVVIVLVLAGPSRLSRRPAVELPFVREVPAR